MDGAQKVLAGLPGAVFYGAALLLITAAGALGYTAGSRAPGRPDVVISMLTYTARAQCTTQTAFQPILPTSVKCSETGNALLYSYEPDA